MRAAAGVALLALLAGAGCRKPEPVSPPVRSIEESPPPLCGQMQSGRYVDSDRGFSIAVPEDWLIEPCRGESDQRLQMTHAVTGVALTVSVYAEAAVELRERSGCLWTFRDTGHYSALAAAQVTVAGCTPWEPTEPRVQGWYTVRGPWAYHLELSLPDGYLGPSLAEGEALIRGFSLD